MEEEFSGNRPKPFQEPGMDSDPNLAAVTKPRPWDDKFAAAFRGAKLGIRGHSSFFVHFFFAALVVASAIACQCTHWEWCILILCIALVITTELVNSAIETLVRGFPPEQRKPFWPALDVAAGAVLVASIFAAAIGLSILVPRFLSFLVFA